MAALRKGKLNKKTIIKQKINFELAKEQVEKNIYDFLTHTNEKLRFEATCRLAEFVLPRKTKVENETITEIRLVANPLMMRKAEDDSEETTK